MITVATFESRTKQQRDELHRKLMRDAYPFRKNYVSVEDVLGAVNGN